MCLADPKTGQEYCSAPEPQSFTLWGANHRHSVSQSPGKEVWSAQQVWPVLPLVWWCLPSCGKRKSHSDKSWRPSTHYRPCPEHPWDPSVALRLPRSQPWLCSQLMPFVSTTALGSQLQGVPDCSTRLLLAVHRSISLFFCCFKSVL